MFILRHPFSVLFFKKKKDYADKVNPPTVKFTILTILKPGFQWRSVC